MRHKDSTESNAALIKRLIWILLLFVKYIFINQLLVLTKLIKYLRIVNAA